MADEVDDDFAQTPEGCQFSPAQRAVAIRGSGAPRGEAIEAQILLGEGTVYRRKLALIARCEKRVMRVYIQLPALLAALFWGGAPAAFASTNTASTNRILIIEPSSMPVVAGRATLTIGKLERANGVYSGGYKINVVPYFFKNETGKLAISVPDEALAKINEGKVAAIVGTATTSGEDGESRHVDATAMPADINSGTIKLWFNAGDRQMVFVPAYHFADVRTPAVWEQPSGTNAPQPVPVAHRATQ